MHRVSGGGRTGARLPPAPAPSSPSQRLAVVGVLAAGAFVVGLLVGAGHGADSQRALALSFTRAWARGDYGAMYSATDAAARRSTSASDFARAYSEDKDLATVSAIVIDGRPSSAAGHAVVVPVRLQTRVFGVLRTRLELPIVGSGSAARVVWSPTLLFPGLRSGERLGRRLTLPPRATLLARNGAVLASGPAANDGYRNSALGAYVDSAVGRTGPIPADRRAELIDEGVPAGASVGLTGLERALDTLLRGRPGGVLLAGRRVLASASASATPPVRTTIAPAVQQAAVAALGSQLGGVVAMRPGDGEILAIAGLGIGAVQPPGSTFKVITLAAALERGAATPSTTFAYRTAAVLEGVQLQNANGESCGGTLALAFAVSCNSVFAPLGARLGAPALVGMAERFGFNQPPGIPGASESTLPPPAQIRGDLAVGSTAIGQDRVQASVLEMALVAATIADDGRRPGPVLLAGPPGPRTPVISAALAHTVRRLMIGVVRQGTGTAAAIPGVTVAGKTGTAELASTAASCAPGAPTGGTACSTATQSDPHNTDAWFTAFAPALHPRIAVGVLLVRDGQGGATAAPAARQVVATALSGA
jgi:transpeptidase family protein/penicillin-binding protein/MecA-like transpeptidase family protein